MQDMEDRSRIYNGYVLKYYKDFLPPMMLNLNLVQDDDSGEGNTIFSATINALIPINEVLGDECIEINTDFIDSRLAVTSLHQRNHR